ncbi:hypothetical protein L3X38_018353 [Prunus dulcis]|uniref:Uncharacterized protein n=1 Tax=Prunus dulcis TaxID=3755 RepID=A0AAD4ZAX8_PRUDU|nr:hypothetical protein L3X38_018353 [Prunus dulcis]
MIGPPPASYPSPSPPLPLGQVARISRKLVSFYVKLPSLIPEVLATKFFDPSLDRRFGDFSISVIALDTCTLLGHVAARGHLMAGLWVLK